MRDAFGIREGQGARATRLLLLVFLLSGAMAALKAAQSGIFLGAYDRTWIPWAFGVSAVVLATASALSVPLAARWGAMRLASRTVVGSLVVILALIGALAAEAPHAAFGTYVCLEAMAGLVVIQVWGVVSEAVDARTAKRLYPVAGLGSSLAWVVAGLAVPLLAAVVGAIGLLVIGGLGLITVALTIALVQRFDAVEVRSGRRRVGLLDGWRGGLATLRVEPLMRLSALLAVAALLLEQLMDFQLMTAVADRYKSAAEIASFYGVFYAVTSGASAFFLATLSGRLFARLGASRSLLVTPAVTAILAIGATIFPALGAVVLLRGGSRVFKQSLWSSAMQQTLLPLPSVPRSQARALTRGVLAPGAYAIAAVVLGVLAQSLHLRWFGLLTALLAGGTTLLIAARARRAYLGALQRAIDDRRLTLDEAGRTFAGELDADAADALAAELADPDAHRAGLAAELLGTASGSAAGRALLSGVNHPDPDVRAMVCDGLAHHGAAAAADAIAEVLGRDPDPDVRRAAARALRKMRPEPRKVQAAWEAVQSDADDDVRAVCRVALMEGRPSEDRRRELLPMLEAKEPAVRHAAATALTTRMMRSEVMQDALVQLLADGDLATRTAAVHTAARLRLPGLLPAVIRLLDDPATAPIVAENLPRWDAKALEALNDWLATAPAHSARPVCRALARMPDTDPFIFRLISHADSDVRLQALRALVAAVQDRDREPMPLQAVRSLVEAEVDWAHGLRSLHAGIAQHDGTPDWEVEEEFTLLTGELERMLGWCRIRLICLLLVSGREQLMAALESAERHDHRGKDAKVAELVELAVPGKLGSSLVPLFEPMSLRDMVASARSVGRLDEVALVDPIQSIVLRGDLHIRRCAMLCFGDVFVSRYPEIAEEDASMMPLFERMRFLRSVPLFAELAGADLRSVGRILEQQQHAAGTTVIHKGDLGESLFVVVEGRVAIRDGAVELAEMGPTEFFGELSVLDRAPRSADAVCLTEATVLELRASDLDELMAKRPRIREEILLVVVRRLRTSTARLAAAR